MKCVSLESLLMLKNIINKVLSIDLVCAVSVV